MYFVLRGVAGQDHTVKYSM